MSRGNDIKRITLCRKLKISLTLKIATMAQKS